MKKSCICESKGKISCKITIELHKAVHRLFTSQFSATCLLSASCWRKVSSLNIVTCYVHRSSFAFPLLLRRSISASPFRKSPFFEWEEEKRHLVIRHLRLPLRPGHFDREIRATRDCGQDTMTQDKSKEDRHIP